MERIKFINADRIRWCCDDFGISLKELASAAGISLVSLSKVMKGEGGLTFLQLRKLSGVFNRGALFFLESGEVSEKQVHTPQFRTIANQKPELSAKLKALIGRVEIQREVYLSLQEDLGSSSLLSFEPPQLPEDDLVGAATIVRRWLGLREKSTFASIRKAVEARGILVFRSNGYSGKWQIQKSDPICGFSLYYTNCPVILVKKQDFESRQTFTLIHELGHLLLHKSSFIDNEEDLYSYQGKERDANAFAGNLLVPEKFLEQIEVGGLPPEVAQYRTWLEPQRKTWGVSAEVILRRLLDSGRLAQTQYESYRRWARQQSLTPKKDGGSREYRHREPGHIFGETFARTVLDALQAKQITLAKASGYLDNLKIPDVHKLEGFYAGL